MTKQRKDNTTQNITSDLQNRPFSFVDSDVPFVCIRLIFDIVITRVNIKVSFSRTTHFGTISF